MFESLLLGIEPVTALAVGVGAVILAPVVNAVGSAMGVDSNKLSESLSESAKEITKNTLVLGFEALENAQTTYAQAEEAFRDLMSDARLEHMQKKSRTQTAKPAEPEVIEIVSH